MKVAAAEFKAKCLALIDRVHETGEPLIITKRGKVVAQLVPASDPLADLRSRLRGTARFIGDPFAPAIDESEIEALK